MKAAIQFDRREFFRLRVPAAPGSPAPSVAPAVSAAPAVPTAQAMPAAPAVLEAPARRQELTVARRAMACEFSVTFPGGQPGAVEAGYAALDEVDRLERKLSVYLDDSDLAELNRRAAFEPVFADSEIYGLLRWAARLSGLTGGSFDAASGALVRAWGFFRPPKRVPSESERLAALETTGSSHVAFDDSSRTVRFDRVGVEFNLGAIGKGFAIDCALRMARVRAALMQGGQSSIKGIGAPPGEPRGWRVALGHPWQADRPIARIWLRDRALGTSGDANQFFIADGERYGHVLDPRTGWPVSSLLSASAIARSATEADALSTAFFVMGLEATRRFCRLHPEFGAVLVAPPSAPGAGPRILAIGDVDAEVI